MERKDFIKAAGIIGLGSIVPVKKATAFAEELTMDTGGCALIPSETAGPYPINLSNNPNMFRVDVRENQAGVPLRQRLRIIGVNNCGPYENARVDIWHCNALGYYSGYTTNGQNGSINYTGATWLRGIQMTDINGEVEFLTIFPGWYSGRIVHIHFQIFLSSVLQVTSQLTYPIAEKNALLTSNAPYSTYGPDPITPGNDNVFSDGTSLQTATLTFNTLTNEYESFLEVVINGTGTVGLQNLEPETGGQFRLFQNRPNPYTNETRIPFSLTFPSDVKIDLFEMNGKKVATLERKSLDSGEHEIEINIAKLGIKSANYLYQIEVSNRNGVYHKCKVMSAEKGK